MQTEYLLGLERRGREGSSGVHARRSALSRYRYAVIDYDPSADKTIEETDTLREGNALELNEPEPVTSTSEESKARESREQHENTWFDLRSRAYWTRTWIVQEVILAKDLHLYCGNQHVSWDLFDDFDLRLAMDLNFRQGRESPYLAEAPPGLNGLKMYLDKTQQGRHDLNHFYSLYTLLVYFWETKCKDPRDRIFALLSLAPRHEGKAALVVDYTKDIVQLYLQAFDYCYGHMPITNGYWEGGTPFRSALGVSSEDIAEGSRKRPGFCNRLRC